MLWLFDYRNCIMALQYPDETRESHSRQRFEGGRLEYADTLGICVHIASLRMNNNHLPIESPLPELQVDVTATEVAPYSPAENPALLYRGPIAGRWGNTDKVYSFVRSFQPPLPDGQLHDFANELLTGVGGVGEVRLVLSPDPHISWWFGSNSWPANLGWPELVPSSVLSSGLATRAGPSGPPKYPRGKMNSAGRSRVMFPVQIGDRSGSIDEIRFYLINFQVYELVDDLLREGQTDSNALLRLRANGWRIDIERRLDFPQALHHLEEQRGYAVTHNCRLWKETEDGEREQFTFEESESVLEAIQLFASFVRGGMVGLAVPVGYREGVSVFEQWYVTPVDSGRYPDPNRPRPFPGWYVWIDVARRGVSRWLPSLFDQFAAKWWNSDTQLLKFWRNVFRELIYTYTDAERIDERRGVVPACTALETLGWAILVVTERWLTGGRQSDGGMSGYDSLTAADQMRLLLRWAGLPTETPVALSRLRQKAVSSNWDCPQVVTWVRNRVVHPDRRDQLVDGIADEAWLMAMWYTELVMLKLLGYDGYYRDRLDDGEIKRVPWVAE